MEENIMENGKKIKFMEKEFLNGLMEEDILAIIRMIKKMVLVFLNGLMEKNIKDIGKMENNKVKVNVIILKKKFGSRESGKMEKKKKKNHPMKLVKEIKMNIMI